MTMCTKSLIYNCSGLGSNELYDGTILLSVKILFNNGSRWSVVASGKVCYTIKLETITLTLVALFWKEKS